MVKRNVIALLILAALAVVAIMGFAHLAKEERAEDIKLRGGLSRHAYSLKQLMDHKKVYLGEVNWLFNPEYARDTLERALKELCIEDEEKKYSGYWMERMTVVYDPIYNVGTPSPTSTP